MQVYLPYLSWIWIFEDSLLNLFLSKFTNLYPLIFSKSYISISVKTVFDKEKQKRFFSSSFSRTSVCYTSDESTNFKVIEKGRQFLIIIGGIKLISIASSFLTDAIISDLVFFKNVNFEIPFDKYELYSIASFSFRILTCIKFDQFLNLKSGLLISVIYFKAIPSF